MYPQQNRGYPPRQPGGNIPRQHAPQHGHHMNQQQPHMGQQQPQHQGQAQGNQQQQPQRNVHVTGLPHATFQYATHPQGQPVYVTNYGPQVAAQNMVAAGQTNVAYPRIYYPYPGQPFQAIQTGAWNHQMGITQPQQAGIPTGYFQATQGQVAQAHQQQQQQLAAAHQQYYAQQHQAQIQQAGAGIQPTLVPVRGVSLGQPPPQTMQVQHQPVHTVHHGHTQQHIQPAAGVAVQGTQVPPPQPPEPREALPPSQPRERRVLKIVNPNTGEPVIETPAVPPPAPAEASSASSTATSTTTTDEVSPTTPSQEPVPPVTVQVTSQSGEEAPKPPETDEQFTRSSARTEFYQKISKSAEEDRPMNEGTNTTTTPTPTTSTPSVPAPAVAAEPEVLPTATPILPPETVPVDNEVAKEENKPQPDVKVQEDEVLDKTLDENNVEDSLVDISSVSLDRYINEEDTPEEEKPVAQAEPAQIASQPSASVEPEKKAPESLVVVKEEPTPTPSVAQTPVVTLPSEPQVSVSTPSSTPVSAFPAHETENKSQQIIKEEKLEETPQLTDLTMQNNEVEETKVVQNGGDQITDGDDDDDDYGDPDPTAADSLEDGEIADGANEEPEELGKKKRIRYDRDALLAFKLAASKDALPDMNSIPPEVIKDPRSSSQNHMRGSSSPNNFSLNRMGGQHGGPGGNRLRDHRMSPQMNMGKGMGGFPGFPGGLGMMIPPPPPGRVPPRVIETMREKVELHKDENRWMPTPVKSRARGVKTEEKDEDEVAKDEIVKKTRGILNKLTPENFDKLVLTFLELKLEDRDDRIAAVIHVVFEKAIDEPSFSTAYAKMVKTVCDKSQLTAKKFRKNILDQCQKEFQKGTDEEGKLKELEEKLASETDESKKEEMKMELADKRQLQRRRGLGNVRFIGELYKLQMLTPKIMIDCVHILLGNQDEESYESLCKLLTTIGQRLDNQLKELEAKAQQSKALNQAPKFTPPEKFMDNTFKTLKALSQDNRLSSRIRFALLDVVELRECSWKPRRDADGPKKIGEVHRDAIRQQQEEKIQIQNLPPQGLPMNQRNNPMPPKKLSDWNTVPASNKSSRFQQLTKKPTGVPLGSESSSSGPPIFAPNRGGQWNSGGGGGGQLPSRTNNSVLPPRLQNQGRYGVLSEDRAPPPTPLRENIVQAPPPPLRTSSGSRESSRPQTPTRDSFNKSEREPITIAPLMPPPPAPQKEAPPIDIPEAVKNIFEEFMSTSNWDDMVFYVKQKFPGDKIVDFVDELSRQVSEMSKESQEKGAGSLIKGLTKRNLITKAQVIKVFTDGVMTDLPDIEVDVPKVTSYLGVFLVELFLDEQDLTWLIPLGERIEEESATVWADLVMNTLNFLKLRLSEEAVQVLYKKTPGANRLPIQEISWVSGESVESLSKKMILVLETEKDSATILQSFKENSWDLREEMTGKSLTEAICQISWKAATGGWDVPVLQKLLPQLITASPRLHPQFWNQAKDFIKRNSIETGQEEALWEEMHKLKLTSNENRQTPY